jgi:CheY-like chemotaxis protein
VVVGDAARLTVVDEGVGIEPVFWPHAFVGLGPADTSSTRVFGGLGLGLSIVRHLVELHGGAVRAMSDGVGKGATFEVTLPAMVHHALADGPFGSSAPAEVPRLDGLRVLVVEDDVDSRDLLGHVLESAGASVRAAGSAEEALTMLASASTDVLVSDIGMPGADGFTLMAAVRERWPGLRAVALTGHAAARDRTRVLAAGFKMHVPKPVDPAELLTVVASLAVRRRADQL